MKKSQERNLGEISTLVRFLFCHSHTTQRWLSLPTVQNSTQDYPCPVSTFICSSDSDRNVRKGESSGGFGFF